MVKNKREHVAKLSYRESLKREQDVLVLAKEMEAQGSADENTRAINNSRTQTHQKDQGRGRDLERIVGRCAG